MCCSNSIFSSSERTPFHSASSTASSIPARRLVASTRGRCDIDTALQCVERHGLGGRIFRILQDGGAAELLDRPQPRRPVVESTGEDHTDRTGPECLRSRPEQRVDGRSKAVLLGPACRQHSARLHQQMVVRHRHVDTPRLEALPLPDRERRQPPGAGQHRPEHTRRFRRHMAASIGAGKSAGSSATIVFSASMAPNEPPITTI